jgi:uncharacterized protein with von Willebrand factor type A (vWA) domain
MFTAFFFALRKYKVPVSLTEWLCLMDALDQGFAYSNLTDFYYLGRAILVKSETHFDQYDQAFQDFFHGIETPVDITEEILEWLKDPRNELQLTPEELEQLRRMSLDELLEEFERRLQEQTERHDGGSHWIGTGGTSPFGRSGANPAGIRLGGSGGGRSALKVASERRFRNYRGDLTLDVRQFKVALKKLRQLTRVGPEDELDLDETIDKTCRNGGEIDLIWRRSRKNAVKLLLLMDVGGSMDPHARICSRLFSAAHSSTHFKEFQYYYFHNCIYESLYRDMARMDSVPTSQILRTLEGDYKVILVGDALMAPEELLSTYGSIYYYATNETPGIVWLKRVADHFKHCVWLNPNVRVNWHHPTLSAIKKIFPMYGLTLDGLDEALKKLIAAA